MSTTLYDIRRSLAACDRSKRHRAVFHVLRDDVWRDLCLEVLELPEANGLTIGSARVCGPGMDPNDPQSPMRLAFKDEEAGLAMYFTAT